MKESVDGPSRNSEGDAQKDKRFIANLDVNVKFIVRLIIIMATRSKRYQIPKKRKSGITTTYLDFSVCFRRLLVLATIHHQATW